MKQIVDIIIIGCGPIGLYGAFYSGVRGMTCTIIDSLATLGGQLVTLYPKKYVYDVPGHAKILAEDLAEELIRQGTQFKPHICLNEKIMEFYSAESQTESHNGDSIHSNNSTDSTTKPERLIRLVSDQNTHFTRSVVIAAGAGAFVSKKLHLQREEEMVGQGLSYFVSDPEDFRGKKVLIVGAGDSAFDWALLLQDYTKELTLIHRSDRFRAMEDSIKKAFESSKIHIRPHTQIKELIGKDRLTSVILENSQTNQRTDEPFDEIIACLGFSTNLGPIRDWSISIEKNSIPVTQTMKTDLEGVWAAGDIAHYPGKLKLIATGFGEVAVAVNQAKQYIDPNSKFFPGHSTSKEETFRV